MDMDYGYISNRSQTALIIANLARYCVHIINSGPMSRYEIEKQLTECVVNIMIH